MKVTVTFGRTGVVVPCKVGWTVRDLIQQATVRYNKLLEQEGDFLVRTHHVEYCDGGILDPDDVLSDLVEDKDKLMAVYEEEEAQQRAAASRSPAPSPDSYQSELSVFQPIRGGEIEVNSSVLKSNTPLLVRSSSESALSPPVENEPPRHEESSAADQEEPPSSSRADVTSIQHNNHFNTSSLTRMVEISGEGGPLGIHVVPYCSSLSGRSLGLYIRGVEEDSRSQREALFEEEECIVSINDHRLMDYTFGQAQEVFRQAMRSPMVRLEVVPVPNRERYERSLIGQLFNPESPGIPKSKEPPPIRAKPVFRPPESPTSRLAEDRTPLDNRPMGSPISISPTPMGQSDSPVLKKGPALSGLVANKKGGRKLKIDLKKGSEGLGFTVVTRDSSLHGPGPILVKNILPRGAAVKDGRLQSGDRILEVNGVDIQGVGQEDLVSMLRSTRQGDSVSLLVLRHEDVFLPREMKEEPSVAPPRAVVSEEGKEQLMFEVPLNDTGSAGLGVSLKGNKSRETGEDLGIFIKSIIHGGAAHKDGRLCINDQMIAVNGETLLGRSNHVAMETLRRSMSHEGNLRGMIQLVVLRTLTDHQTTSPNRSFDSSHGHAGLVSPANGPTQLPMVANCIYEKSNLSNGSYGHMEEEEEEEELSGQEVGLSNGQMPYLQHSLGPVRPAPSPGPAPSPEPAPGHSTSSRATGQQAQPQYQHIKASKSMDLVADESKPGSRTGPETGPRPPVELGPTLGLKKSSSLESLQMAVSELHKNQPLPFHRPRPNMVRGRGCNESFRAAIDKSYDGPAEEEDDDVSDQSSGQETPVSGTSHKGAGEAEEEQKDKKKKEKGKKKKEKNKGKGKEKKRNEDGEETDKKTKKKGFALLRFAKRRVEKKAEVKATLQRQKSDLLSDEELERMKEERERIEAKHTELRERQSRDQRGGGASVPEVEHDSADPNYACINPFRERDALPHLTPRTHPQSPPSPTAQPLHPHHLHHHHPPPHPHPHLHPRQPPAHHGPPGHHGNDPSRPLDGLYATVNKQRAPPLSPPSSMSPANDSAERIQLLRREYHQARREGAGHEALDPRRHAVEHDAPRMPVRGPDPRLAPRYEEVERQYASLPRRGPVDPSDYPHQGWAAPREAALYPGPQPHQSYPQAPQPYHQASPSYPGPKPHSGAPYLGYPPREGYPRAGDPRGLDSGYYQPPQPLQRGPLRQDVPPSPTLPLRGPRYDTLTRGNGAGSGYRKQLERSPDRYGYGGGGGGGRGGEGGGGRHQTDPRHKNPMTAAV